MQLFPVSVTYWSSQEFRRLWSLGDFRLAEPSSAAHSIFWSLSKHPPVVFPGNLLSPPASNNYLSLSVTSSFLSKIVKPCLDLFFLFIPLHLRTPDGLTAVPVSFSNAVCLVNLLQSASGQWEERFECFHAMFGMNIKRSLKCHLPSFSSLVMGGRLCVVCTNEKSLKGKEWDCGEKQKQKTALWFWAIY